MCAPPLCQDLTEFLRHSRPVEAAGTEIIRRVVGDSKVMEVTSVTDPAQRLPMERALIQLGIYLIKNRTGGLTGAAVTEEFRKILAEGRGTHGQNG